MTILRAGQGICRISEICNASIGFVLTLVLELNFSLETKLSSILYLITEIKLILNTLKAVNILYLVPVYARPWKN